MRNVIFALLFVFLLLPAFALDIIFLRHAQTIGNVSGNYSGDNGDTLTYTGKIQAGDSVAKLEKFNYDAILVSPSSRTRLTILPYLEENNARACIWPELAECCFQDTIKDGFSPVKNIISERLVELNGEERQYFFLVDDKKHYYLSDYYQQGLQQIEDLYHSLVKNFWYKDMTILLVGHGMCGKKLIERLLGHGLNAPLQNARITHLRQRPDGNFNLLLINDRRAQ